MLDTKKTIAKILSWISSYKSPHFEYVGNVGSTLYNSGWTAPDDGILVLHGVANNSSGVAYWYVNDASQGNIQLGAMFWPSANQTRRSTSFPVIKGHKYNTSSKSAITTANAHFYKLVGGSN